MPWRSEEQRLNLKLAYILETHAHADHVTSAGKLREMTGAKAAVPSGCDIPPADVQLADGDILHFGNAEEIAILHTPGHTAGSMSYVWRGNVFTGDTLLINGCGRTDFQGGSAHALHNSVMTKLFVLPDQTRLARNKQEGDIPPRRAFRMGDRCSRPGPTLCPATAQSVQSSLLRAPSSQPSPGLNNLYRCSSQPTWSQQASSIPDLT